MKIGELIYGAVKNIPIKEYFKTEKIKVETVKVGKHVSVEVKTTAKILLPASKAWWWLKGKKRAIGVGVGLAGFVVPDPLLSAICKYIGGAMLSVGVADAALRKQTTYGKEGQFGKPELALVLQDLFNSILKLIKILKGG